MEKKLIKGIDFLSEEYCRQVVDAVGGYKVRSINPCFFNIHYERPLRTIDPLVNVSTGYVPNANLVYVGYVNIFIDLRVSVESANDIRFLRFVLKNPNGTDKIYQKITSLGLMNAANTNAFNVSNELVVFKNADIVYRRYNPTTNALDLTVPDAFCLATLNFTGYTLLIE